MRREAAPAPPSAEEEPSIKLQMLEGFNEAEISLDQEDSELRSFFEKKLAAYKKRIKDTEELRKTETKVSTIPRSTSYKAGLIEILLDKGVLQPGEALLEMIDMKDDPSAEEVAHFANQIIAFSNAVGVIRGYSEGGSTPVVRRYVG